jgi:hypothetical protein
MATSFFIFYLLSQNGAERNCCFERRACVYSRHILSCGISM